MSSSSNDYSFDYDKYGEPSDRNRIGSGDLGIFGTDYYTEYKVKINGEEYREKRWNSGQIHRSKDGSHWWRVK